MSLTHEELEILKNNSLNFANAKVLAEQIESDKTLGGVFPNGEEGDFSVVNKEKFKGKWCSWWKVARILLKIVKVFTGEKADRAIDNILKVGDQIC